MIVRLVIFSILYLKVVVSYVLDDLALVEKIKKNHEETLPFLYNASMMGGYLNTPSARTPSCGTWTMGGGSLSLYNGYGVGFQYFDRLELSLNYRAFKNDLRVSKKEEFGDRGNRVASGKVVLTLPNDWPTWSPRDKLSWTPAVAIGVEDFLGTMEKPSIYVIATQSWIYGNLETSIGYGWRQFQGLFGGVAWSPWRQTKTPFLKDITLIAEYENFHRHSHHSKQPQKKNIMSHLNGGITYTLKKRLQITVGSIHGKDLSVMGSLSYPLGTSKGLIPKDQEPFFYTQPVNLEPLRDHRSQDAFVQELETTLQTQGFDLYSVEINSQNDLWLKIINTMYRDEKIVRERIQRVLGSLLPLNIPRVFVMIESDGIICQGYVFKRDDLYQYRLGNLSPFTMKALSPMIDPTQLTDKKDVWLQKKKKPFFFTLLPSIQTYWASLASKIKYNVSLIGGVEGYLLNDVYYALKLSYNIHSNIANLQKKDRPHPSQLPNVRTDIAKYFRSNSINLEHAYLQKSWSLENVSPPGFFCRLAAGYFEQAYGGFAVEALYFPAGFVWALGVEQATVWKRCYTGLLFTNKIRYLQNNKENYKNFTGNQFFLNFHYMFSSLNLDCKLSVGQFLAKDKGIRLEINRTFSSGLHVGAWYTITNGSNAIGRENYFDKGFILSLPIDFFLRRSSRVYANYKMAAWLCDVGAIASTGRSLYKTIRTERCCF
jgi:hypothetical protein